MSNEVTLYCTFHSAGRLYGVPVLDVKEVTTETACTRIPHAPQAVLGLVNIRGHIFLALNLATLLSDFPHEAKPDSQLVIFKSTVGPTFGIVVDQVGDIVSVSASQTETLAREQGVQLDSHDRRAFVSHVCKLDHQLLIVLDPRKFLPSIEQSITLSPSS